MAESAAASAAVQAVAATSAAPPRRRSMTGWLLTGSRGFAGGRRLRRAGQGGASCGVSCGDQEAGRSCRSDNWAVAAAGSVWIEARGWVFSALEPAGPALLGCELERCSDRSQGMCTVRTIARPSPSRAPASPCPRQPAPRSPRAPAARSHHLLAGSGLLKPPRSAAARPGTRMSTGGPTPKRPLDGGDSAGPAKRPRKALQDVTLYVPTSGLPGGSNVRRL